MLALAGACLVALNEWKVLNSLSAGFYDYGLIRSMIANTAAGDPVLFRPADRLVSHLGTHFTPLLFGLVAAARVVSSQQLYGYAMAAAWYAAVLVFAVWAGRASRDPWIGMAAGAMAFFNVSMRRIFYSGHYEHLEILFVLLAVWAFTERRWAWFVVALTLDCLVREDAAVYAVALCAGLWITSRDRTGLRVAAVAGAGALAYFLLAWLWWMPHFRTVGPQNPAAILDERWGSGGSLAAVAMEWARHPVTTLRAVFNHRLLRLVAGFGLIPLLAPRFFTVACLPVIALFSLSRLPDYALFRYYNAAAFLGTLLAATVLGLIRWRLSFHGAPWLRRSVTIAVLGVGLVVGSRERINPNLQRDLWGFGFTAADEPFPVGDQDRALVKALREFPYQGRSAAASFRVISQIPSRPNVWYLTRWQDVNPDLIFVDPVRDGDIIRREMHVASVDVLYSSFRRAGYVRRPPVEGCEVFEKVHH
jgi:hypothetical protein